jgi:hypothetical protein
MLHEQKAYFISKHQQFPNARRNHVPPIDSDAVLLSYKPTIFTLDKADIIFDTVRHIKEQDKSDTSLSVRRNGIDIHISRRTTPDSISMVDSGHFDPTTSEYPSSLKSSWSTNKTRV